LHNRTTVRLSSWRPGLFAAGLLIILIGATWAYVEDDAYIHCQFARNLYHRGEFSFNPGEIVFGDSSLLWVFLLVALRWAGLPFVVSTKALSGVLALVSCALFVRIVGKCTAEARPRSWSPVLFLSHPFLIGAVTTGMETCLALSCLMGLALAAGRAFRSDRKAWYAGLGLAAATGTLVRPEFLLLGPCLVTASAFCGWRRRSEEPWAGKTLLLILVWAAAVAVVGAACYHYFGQVLPTTLRAKSCAAGLFSLDGMMRTAAVLALGFGPPAFVALAGGISWRTLTGAIARAPLVLSLWTLLLIGGYVAMSANVQSRYALLVWPWAGACFALLAEGAPTPARRKGVWAGGVAVLLALSCLTALPAQASRLYNSRQVRALCDEVARDTPADAVLGVYAIGEIGYRTQRRLVDLGCIITPKMADVPPEKRLGFALSLGATYLMVQTTDLARLGISPERVAIRANYRHATWQFPPNRYWRGWEEALVPVSEMRLK
jgi:hypothetical protein